MSKREKMIRALQDAEYFLSVHTTHMIDAGFPPDDSAVIAKELREVLDDLGRPV